MTGCTRLSDRMLDIRMGAEWTSAERAHLAECPDCAAEWRLIQAAAALGARLRLPDSERIAGAVLDRLAREPAAEPGTAGLAGPGRRLGVWWAGGLVAAALMLAVALALWPSRPADPGRQLVVLSELEDLSAGELEGLLGELPSADQVAMPSGAMGMSDLSAAELERVLAAWEG